MNNTDISNLMKEIEAQNPDRMQILNDEKDPPRVIGSYNAKHKFTPDVVARFGNKKHFYAFEKNIIEKDIHDYVFKWILFSAEARKTAGKFFLVVPKGKASICEALIDEKQLDLELILL